MKSTKISLLKTITCCPLQTAFCLGLAVPLMFVSFLKQPACHAFNMRRERHKLPNTYVFSVRKLNGKENSGRKRLYIRSRKIHELCVTLLRPINWTMVEEIIEIRKYLVIMTGS